MNTACRVANKLSKYATGFISMVSRALLPSRYPKVEEIQRGNQSVDLLAFHSIKTQEDKWPVLPRFDFNCRPIMKTDLSAESSEFDQLKVLFESDEWPEAVSPDLICQDDDEKGMERRAERMLDYIVGDLKGKRFLDFGCGRGHTVELAKKRGSRTSAGYDPFDSAWTATSAWTDTDIIYGIFDVILMYDVVDHLQRDSLQEVLETACRHLDKDGTIYIRCHPWTCSTGGHLYKQKNKGFAHVIFTPDELVELGLKPMHTRKVGLRSPVNFYEEAIAKAGLRIRKQNTIFDSIPPFFLEQPLVWKRFQSGVVTYHRFAEIRFIDFEVVKSQA